ncbi:MAG TPA: S1 family peptidase [Microlunatus sp.]|nr:S1 family peptidase [Microlunatus sp.]
MLQRGRTPALRIVLALMAGLALLFGTLGTARAEPTEEGPAALPQVEALARSLGLTTAEAKQLLAVQVKLSALAVDLEVRLGDDIAAGSWIADGKLVVAVTDEAAAEQVRAAGAEPRTVQHSKADLNRQRRKLDSFARSEGAGKVQSWRVDVKTNSLLIRTEAGADDQATRAFLAEAEELDVEVKVEKVRGSVRPTADLYGGEQVEMSNGYVCSAGFNAETSSGEAILLTAGHCAEGSPTFSKDGTEIGATRDYSFPGDDWGAVDVSSDWTQQGAVDKWDGSYVEVTEAGLGAVGSALCKSGRTTGWTCGEIVSHDESVNYGDGDIVSGLTQHSACVEQGDSGGSNVSGSVAQGLTSGGMLYQQGNQLVCGEKVGEPNVGFFQPVEEALAANDATLVTAESADTETDPDAGGGWGWRGY